MINRSYFYFLVPLKQQMSIIVVLSLCSALFQIPIPLLYKVLLDTVLPHHTLVTLCWIVASAFGLIVGGAICNLYAETIGIKANTIFRYKLKQALYLGMGRLTFQDYSRWMSGELTARMTHDVDKLTYLLPSGVVQIIKNSVVTLGFMTVLLMLNWKLTLMLSSVLPLFFIFFVTIQKRVRNLSNHAQHYTSVTHAALQERIEGMRDIHVTNSKQYQDFQASQSIKTSEMARQHLLIQQSKINTGMIVFQLISIGIVWGIGGWSVMTHTMTLGSMIGFSYTLNALFVPLSALFQLGSGLPAEKAILDRLYPFLESSHRPQHTRPNSLAIKGHIQFENVEFRYSDTDWVLQNISLEVFPGEIVAITGENGSGKSTLLSLLLKLYSPTHGKIFIDGIDIEILSCDFLRVSVGYVPQHAFLFNDTIQNNILMGRSISDSHWEQVIQWSGIMEFIPQFSQGYATVIGEKGQLLSGGQRQKIAIARALVTNPPILVLDEPSNHIDHHSKIHIKKCLLALAQTGKTIIVVSHDSDLVDGCRRYHLEKITLQQEAICLK